MSKPRYSEFYEDIDVDQFESAIGFVPNAQTGNEDTGHCPFPENHTHGDTTGKFSINREKKVYNCWVCCGGSLLSLTMELYGFDVDEATTWLRQFAVSDTRSDREFQDYLLAMLGDAEKHVKTMPYFNERVLDRFTDNHDYFLERGIRSEVIEKYNLRFGKSVMKASPMKRDGEGQTHKTESDYFGPAAIFPHYWNGKLVGWQHRWVDYPSDKSKDPDWPKWLPKYTNTTDFPKDDTLFNYDEALKSSQPVIVCESVATVLWLAGYGKVAVSYFGSKINDVQLRLLRRLNHGVILAPDNDSTGDSLLGKAIPYLERFIPVWHADKVDSAVGADLGDYAKIPNEYDRYLILTDHLENRIQPATIRMTPRLNK
jgi:hypothetical protein